MIHFRCPQCHTLLKVPDEKAGLTGKCPKCQALITAHSPETQASAAPSWKEDTQPVSHIGSSATSSTGEYGFGHARRSKQTAHAPAYRYAKALGSFFIIFGWVICGVGSIGFLGTLANPDNWDMPAGFFLFPLLTSAAVVIGGLFCMAFGQMLHCIRDTAQNSFYLRGANGPR